MPTPGPGQNPLHPVHFGSGRAATIPGRAGFPVRKPAPFQKALRPETPTLPETPGIFCRSSCQPPDPLTHFFQQWEHCRQHQTAARKPCTPAKCLGSALFAEGTGIVGKQQGCPCCATGIGTPACPFAVPAARHPPEHCGRCRPAAPAEGRSLPVKAGAHRPEAPFAKVHASLPALPPAPA